MTDTSRQAYRIRISGLVQGVGFRPFVWRLAHQHQITGWVHNDGQGVAVHAEGTVPALTCFLAALADEAPPLARINDISKQATAIAGHDNFIIETSQAGAVHTMIGADTAVCPACLAELFDPANRRWRHAFITCTHCGPRYTLTARLPYDRAQTSMARFGQCPQCLREYTDPAHRRFHAETNCCPSCGPQLQLCTSAGEPLPGDPISQALALLRQGKIVAIKGLGGFHLACDARNSAAVATLRQRKAREEKPFALMAANALSAQAFVTPSATELAWLQSRERPVVLLPAADGQAADLPGVAPGLDTLGLMLPCTPLQWLLFHEAAGRPSGTAWLDEAQALLLVMTSANPAGEPLTIANSEALARLADIADACLLHDRDIVIRCDDSVIRPVAGHMQFVRRARGYTPQPIALPGQGPCVLALGGWLKNTLCLTRDDQAWVSQHIGDLDNAASCTFLEETITHLTGLLDVQPQLIAHDRHPDFHSTRLAHALAERWDVPTLAVQHHHAHIAAIAAEHGHTGPLLGLALDGVGLGDDGGAWGGELLGVYGAQCRRLAHLAPLPLPGGDRAAREPWRMAAAALWQLGRGDEIATRFADQSAAHQLESVLDRGLNCPPSSSMGRLFDAAAALLGIYPVAAYEGQAAMALESLAARHGPATAWPAWTLGPDGLDFSPLLACLADWAGAPGEGAARFHATLAAGLVAWTQQVAAQAHWDTIALGGGCFLNAILSSAVARGLQDAGLRVLRAQALPPNDGGLSLGQAWVALRTLQAQQPNNA